MSLDSYLQETDFYFPAFEGRPYTVQFAVEYIQLTTLLSIFWEGIQKASTVELDLYYHGEVSLPKWDFRVGDTKFEEFPDNTSLVLRFDKGAVSISNSLHPAKIFSNQASFKSFLSHIFPYIREIKIDGVVLKN